MFHAGQQLWVVPEDHHSKDEPKRATVEKVGRSLVTVEGLQYRMAPDHPTGRCYLADGSQLYVQSEENYWHELNRARAMRTLTELVCHGLNRFTTEQIDAASAALGYTYGATDALC